VAQKQDTGGSKIISSEQAAAGAPEQIIGRAVSVLRARGADAQQALDAIDAPIYVTDAEGRITFFNQACIPFAGRTPVIGEDRWCVTWRLFTDDGAFLPHDQCPMAVAVRERRPVRGVEAIAERPDGTRRHFSPFPTPIFEDDGAFAGAVNLLVDISDRKRADYLTSQAQRCRRLAGTIGDRGTVETLSRMAAEYEAEAGALDRPN
jgi:PAS domain S-box-containing protein